MHALIIEDEPLIALDLEMALRELGFTDIVRATTQAGAIIEASRSDLDLITADFQLAHGDGVSAIEAMPTRPRPPTVFITGSKSAVLDRMPNAVVVAKPYCYADIARAVQQVRAGFDKLPAPAHRPV